MSTHTPILIHHLPVDVLEICFLLPWQLYHRAHSYSLIHTCTRTSTHTHIVRTCMHSSRFLTDIEKTPYNWTHFNHSHILLERIVLLMCYVRVCTCTCVSVSLSLTHAHTNTHTLSLSLPPLKLTLSHTRTLSLSPTTHTHSPSLSSCPHSVAHVRKSLPLESLRELAEEIGFQPEVQDPSNAVPNIDYPWEIALVTSIPFSFHSMSSYWSS